MTRIALVIILTLLAACSQPEIKSYNLKTMPEHLSDWGMLWVDGTQLVINKDSVPYDLNSALFTDYAHKLRTVWVPPVQSAKYSEEEDITMPIGSIISKTFFYPREGNILLQTDDTSRDHVATGLNLNNVQLIETRMMVHTQQGWQGAAYVWNEDQKEATLALTGDSQDLTLRNVNGASRTFSYHVPDANQCQSCHVENLQKNRMSPLGFKVRHINKTYKNLKQNPNQLANLNEKKMLDISDIAGLARNVDWQDSSLTIESRARAYLDINCAHCHNPQGSADTSGLFLHAGETNIVRLGVCKLPIAAGQGTGGRPVAINPGHADASILTFRMQSVELGAMMPELGRSTVHKEAVQLIEQWINQMDGTCSPASSPTSSTTQL